MGDDVGDRVGAPVGASVGDGVGMPIGEAVGDSVVALVGASVGDALGETVGISVGNAVGDRVGALVGTAVAGRCCVPPHLWGRYLRHRKQQQTDPRYGQELFVAAAATVWLSLQMMVLLRTMRSTTLPRPVLAPGIVLTV